MGKEYDVLRVYYGEHYGVNKLFIKLRHNICGHEYSILATRFIKEGLRCRCNYPFKDKLNTKIYKQRVREKYGSEYTVLGEYTNNKKRIEIRHNKCGNSWTPQAGQFLLGYGCPVCKYSKVEERVRNYLEQNGIKYTAQATFSDCKHKNRLRFDFKVMRSKRSWFLLELDGHFHYQDIYGGLSSQKQRDKLKDDYCKEKGISLIRVPYWQFDIVEQMLDQQLKLEKKRQLRIAI